MTGGILHWVCVTFVVCLPVVNGAAMFITKEAALKRKNRWKESGAFFLTVVSMLTSD